MIDGLVAWEDADTGDHWGPHRFARCCDCAYFLAKVLNCLMSLHSRRPCQHEMLFSCVWVKRDMFFIILFSECLLEKLYCFFFFVQLEVLGDVSASVSCVAHLLLVSNADTFHLLMLMSWSPGDGSGTPRESPAKLRKKSTIRDAIEKNWIPHAYTRFDICSVEL